jgi:hypothetical protein
MSVTTTPLTPAELRAGLEELLELAAQYAALESRIESKALELERSDWEFAEERPVRYMNAVGGELRCVYDAANKENGYTALDFCQSIQDAIDVLTFAIERDDRAS